jgi:peptide/nickel transport system ATP-binding protein
MTVVLERPVAGRPSSGPPPPLVEVADLRVRFGPRTAPAVVDGISFTLARGECLALVGESGSGKSVTSRTLVGLTGERSLVTFDRLRFDGEDISQFSSRTWRRVRGGRIGFVMQDALSSLDSLRPVGHEVAEALKLHEALTRKQRDEKVVALLRDVGVPEPEFRASQYPHELSGGLRQRALIASAIACSPQLIIADEPTTSLDATVGAQVIQLLASLKTSDTGLLIISHDLAVVASLADRVAVMRAGHIVEEGPTARILSDPSHEYTKALLAAIPSEASKGTRLSYAQAALGVPRASRTPGPRTAPPGTTTAAPATKTEPVVPGAQEPIVRATHLSKSFTGPDKVRREVVADVSFELLAGETLGIVGESGSGKTTTARLVLGLEVPDAGTVTLMGHDWTSLDTAGRRAARKRIQFVYQDPLSSFDPRYTVERVIGEALALAGYRGDELGDRLDNLLRLVSLDASFAKRRPIELSGGQRQRVAVARALAPGPEVLVLDEPVSALDVSVQARILDLLTDLQEQLGVAYLFISHDLGVVHHMSDRVLVMKDGAVVESGDVGQIFSHPAQDYTRALLQAIPRLRPGRTEDA